MIQVGILAMAQRRFGGTLPYTLSMIQALQRLPVGKFRFVIFTAATNREYDSIGLPIIHIPGTLSTLAERVVGNDIFAGVDLVVAPIYSTVLLATRQPFVFTLHDVQERYFPDNFSFMQRLWRRTVNTLLISRAQRVLCESEFVSRDIQNFFGTMSEKIVVLPAPPVATLQSLTVSGAELEAVRGKFELPRRYLLYPAQFWPHKNHMRLIEAFAKVVAKDPECGLVLTGRPEGEYRKVMEYSKSIGMDGKVLHIGNVEYSELAALYKLATIAVIPTLFESISIPIYEAFSLGVPVCASNVVALPEQVADAGVLFEPTSVQDIAEKLLKLLSDPSLRAEYVRRGYERMRSMTHERYSDRLQSLIDSLVGGGV